MTNEQFFQVWDETIKEMEMVVKPELLLGVIHLNLCKNIGIGENRNDLTTFTLKGIMWKTFIDSIKIN